MFAAASVRNAKGASINHVDSWGEGGFIQMPSFYLVKFCLRGSRGLWMAPNMQEIGMLLCWYDKYLVKVNSNTDTIFLNRLVLKLRDTPTDILSLKITECKRLAFADSSQSQNVLFGPKIRYKICTQKPWLVFFKNTTILAKSSVGRTKNMWFLKRFL